MIYNHHIRRCDGEGENRRCLKQPPKRYILPKRSRNDYSTNLQLVKNAVKSELLYLP